jgi:DNA polymerase
MTILQCDFETASDCDLIKHGIYHYASDPTTRVLMLGWAFDDDPVEVWLPGQPFPQKITDHILSGGTLTAWNAQFERLIWAYVLSNDFEVPNPKLEQWKCSAARARAHGLPGSLDQASKALGIPLQKDAAGSALIKKYCLKGAPETIPLEDLAAFVEYCRQDVAVERQICQVLRDLDDCEWQDFWNNEKINDRGIPIDVEFARFASGFGKQVRENANAGIRKLTKGVVNGALKRKDRDAWLRERLTPEQLQDIEGRFGKFQRALLLAREDLHPEARALTELVEEAGGATLQKYEAFVDRSLDGRVFGALMFSGGGQTGRFSSTGLQIHNLRRDAFEDPQAAIDEMYRTGKIENPALALSKLIRAVICSERNIVSGDFSNIEGRMAPWLEGTELGEAKLDVFRAGTDPYKINAAAIFEIPYDAVNADQRQAGKCAELALGFLGGVNALNSMGANYGVTFSEEEALKVRDAWRSVNPWAMSLGRKLEDAAYRALRAPGEWFEAGRVAYAFDGADWLWCRLPSGRFLAYFKPRIEEQITSWGEPKMCVTAQHNGGRPKFGQAWPRRALYSGLLLENITQGAAACYLRDTLDLALSMGIEVVAHVHDEIVAEGCTEELLKKCMSTPPAWAQSLPMGVKVVSGKRFS